MRLEKDLQLLLSHLSQILRLFNTCEVTVYVPVTSIELDKSEIELDISHSKKLTATILPDNATNKSVTWKSNNDSIVTVEQDGTIKAIGKGTTTITIESVDVPDIKTTCTVTVHIPTENIKLNKSELELSIGYSEKLIATLSPEDATNDIVWSSSDPSIATVDQDGTIKAINNGPATITAWSKRDPNIKVTCEVTVKVIYAESIQFKKDRFEIIIGRSEKLTVDILPKYTTNKDVIWSSNDDSIASVNQDGTVNANKKGSVIITACLVDNQDIKKTCVVAVKNPYTAIVANTDSTVKLSGGILDLKWSKNCRNWNQYSDLISIDKGEILYLKGNNNYGWSTSYRTSTFVITGTVSLDGSVMSLVYEDSDNTWSTPEKNCFAHLFENCTAITTVNQDFLPAMHLSDWCYDSMFLCCKSLTQAPNLPAIYLGTSCYDEMFKDCTSLKKHLIYQQQCW